MIDLHCHIDLYEDPTAVLERAHKAGVYVLSVTTTPKAWIGTNNFAKGYKQVRTALGLHPHLAHQRYAEMPIFEKIIPEVTYVGEIGLDKGPHYREHFERQKEIFSRILVLSAQHGGKILTIHSTYAANEVLEELEKCPKAGPAILHWFTGTPAQLERAIKFGCWFSIGPKMLQSNKGKDLIQRIPIDRILLETDGPFTKNKDGFPYEPKDTPSLLKPLALLKGETEEKMRGIILSNFKTLTNFNVRNM